MDKLTADPVTGAFRNKRVLVVDDDREIGEFMLAALEAQGYDGRWCDSVADARLMLADWTPEIVVVDLMMLPEDGSALIPWLKKRFGKQVRTVLYSGRQDAETTGIVAGITKPDAFVKKPFDLDHLYRAVAGE